MMSRKKWIAVVAVLELLPLVASADVAPKPQAKSAVKPAVALAPAAAKASPDSKAKASSGSKVAAKKASAQSDDDYDHGGWDDVSSQRSPANKAAAAAATDSDQYIDNGSWDNMSNQTAPAKKVAAVKPQEMKAEPKKDIAHDLDLREAGEAVKFLHIQVDKQKVDGFHTIGSVSLNGVMYKACADHFSISNSVVDPMTVGKHALGFRISDDGEGLACVRKMKRKKVHCIVGETCVRVSKHFAAAKMDLKSYGKDGKIGLLYRNTAQDDDRIKAADIGDSLNFTSVATLKKRIREALNSDMKFCRKDLDQLSGLRAEITKDLKIGVIAQDEADHKLAAVDRTEENLVIQQEKAEIKAFEKEGDKAKTLAKVKALKGKLATYLNAHPSLKQDLKDRISSLRDKLSDRIPKLKLDALVKKARKARTLDEAKRISDKISKFADDHPDLKSSLKTKIRAEQDDLRKTILTSINAPVSERLAAANHVIQNMMDLDDTSRDQMDQYRMNIQGNDISIMAESLKQEAQSGMPMSINPMTGTPMIDPFAYQTRMMQMQSDFMQMRDLQSNAWQDYQGSCGSSAAGGKVSSTCKEARTNLDSAMSLPMVQQQAVRQQAAIDQQLFAQMRQAYSGTYGLMTNNYMPGLAGAGINPALNRSPAAQPMFSALNTGANLLPAGLVR